MVVVRTITSPKSRWILVLLTLVLLCLVRGPVEGPQEEGSPQTVADGDDVQLNSARHSTALPVNKVLDLSRRPDALGFRLGVWDYDLGGKSHVQGIARANAADGTPYLFVTTSGGPGKLLVVEMASRDPTGERMRSNRIDPVLDTKDTAPPVEDRVVVVLDLEWNHGGGAQVIDGYLVVAVESGIGVYQNAKGSFIVYDVSDPRNITQIYQHPDLGHKAGVLAVTREDDGHYLVMLGPSAYCGCEGTSWDNSNHYQRFFRSTQANNMSGGFDYVNEWHADGDFNRQDNLMDPTYQTLNFVRDDVTGYLYVVGMWNSYVDPGIAGGDDFIDVFRVTKVGGEYQVLKDAMVHRLHMNSKSADSQEQCNFIASGGLYISPGGELILYSTTHYKETASSIDYIRVAEYRSIDTVSAGSPLWGPRAVIDPLPREVEEGTNVSLDGSGSTAQHARGFVELFEDDGYQGKRVIIDWADYGENMVSGGSWVDLEFVDGFGADADSMKFYVPPGSAVMLAHKDWESNRLGRLVVGDPGTGVVSLSDLDGYRWEMLFNDVWYPTDDPMGDDIRFLVFIGNGTVDLVTHAWDLGDGTNVTGPRALHHAYVDDGLYHVNLTVNETDGDEARTNATIRVLNVAPSVVAGDDIAVDEDAEAVLDGTFTDPGILDTHTIEWDLGDGTTVVDTLSPRHTYQEPGTYLVRLTVRDDDGGVGNDTLEVTVRDVTPPVAVPAGDLEVDEGDAITLDGSGSSDNVGIASYAWTFLYDGQMETLEGETAGFTFQVPGTYKVRLTVTDLAGLEDHSDLTVTVIDVNEPPVIVTEVATRLEALEDEPFDLVLEGQDGDGDTLAWSDDTDLFEIGPGTGAISFVPVQDDVGIHDITVTIDDGRGGTDELTLTLEVVEVNDPPEFINEMPPQAGVYEDEVIWLSLPAEDEEDDDLTWSSDSDRFPVSPTNGSIRFDPLQDDVGDWWFNVTVEDSGGLTDAVSFKIVVENVNDAPVITSLSPENGTEWKEGKKVTLAVVATDEDGDDLTVTWTSDGETLGTGTSLDYKKLKSGTRVVKVSVSDGEVSTEDEITLVIKKEEESPGLGAVVTCLALLAVVMLSMRRRSRP